MRTLHPVSKSAPTVQLTLITELSSLVYMSYLPKVAYCLAVVPFDKMDLSIGEGVASSADSLRVTVNESSRSSIDDVTDSHSSEHGMTAIVR